MYMHPASGSLYGLDGTMVLDGTCNSALKKPMPTRSLLPTKPGKTGPGSVSHDIFLNIVDMLVEIAQEEAKPSKFWVVYSPNKEGSVALRGRDNSFHPDKAKWSIFQKQRLFTIRLPLQICSKTRSIVHQKFLRFKAFETYSQDLADVWILPKVDYFCLPLSNININLAEALSNYHANAALQQSHCSRYILYQIQKVQLNCPHQLSPASTGFVSSLVALPRLTEITILYTESYGVHRMYDFKPFQAGVIDIPDKLTSLVMLRAEHGCNFEAFWAPFKAKGVRLLARLNPSSDIVLEVVSTREGARMQWLPHVLDGDMIEEHYWRLRL
ncbi:hypothetical protein CH63R_13221 [Colletotrichum higginsianum IMI 349063]|uniref:Uncharacterized protein n=3 Tax=Colletotrichum higginsianum TaxID=80884 RepID=A0A1B7XWH4_COLHI|nr:hypothetical protein CH63R_13221 [Colletotrichum higginsianum IMI 349063]OBR04094.1 hypothetical protein CH63R_13221 [Colletotrichum higginsianum IMI 349063]TIC90281.1 hypothetical protein CH35J_012082 [Colletotrichum higginsianum]